MSVSEVVLLLAAVVVPLLAEMPQLLKKVPSFTYLNHWFYKMAVVMKSKKRIFELCHEIFLSH